MPVLSYSSVTDYPFQPFTKIYSADINGMFSAIQTLLNTTKLDMANIQTQVLTRYGSSSALTPGTANYVVYNDSNGNLQEAAQLPTAQGGLGANLSPSSPLQAGYSIVVNPTGTGFILSSASGSSTTIFNYQNFS